MDRLTARSNCQDWPLSSAPPPSLINVSKESKRHGRLMSARMVNLTLAQMSEELEQQQQKKREQQGRYDSEKCGAIDERERLVRKRKTNVEGGKRKKVVAPDTLDEMFEAVDELLSSPDSVVEIAPVRSSVSRIEHSSPRTTSTTAPPARKPTTLTSTLPFDLDFRSALTSNPPTSSDLAHARALTAAHAKDAPSKPTTTLTQRDADTQNKLVAFDAVTQYGQVARRSKLTRYLSVAKRTKVSISEAVHRGFRGMVR